MKSIKLITLWFGDLPVWYPQFLQRMEANRLFDFELVQPTSVDAVNKHAEDRCGMGSNKATSYSLCDLRPLFGRLFEDKFQGYEWFGWCDLDIVVGNLDKLLIPLFPDYDIISTDKYMINGAMTLLRNTGDVCSLYSQNDDYKEVMRNPGYCNFDEAGFNEEAQIKSGLYNGNPSFTHIVKSSGLRVLYDDRSWTEGKEIIYDENGIAIPVRCCSLIENTLVEVPTLRELVLYHFTDQWPLPNRYHQHLESQYDRLFVDKKDDVNLITESVGFWFERVKFYVQNEGDTPIHVVSLDIPKTEWDNLQSKTATLIKQFIPSGSKVLDGGCNYGPLLEAFKLANVAVDYTGIDLHKILIEFAESRYPGRLQDCFFINMPVKFEVADLRKLPFPDDVFDWCICRSVEGTVKTIDGLKAWSQMECEMLRVAKKIMLINLQGEYEIKGR